MHIEMKKTKIVCTLGPSCEDPGTIKRMLEEGMDVARLNFSHGNHEEHGEKISALRKACEEVGRPAAVMLDTRGPEIRLGNFADDKVILEEGDSFTLYPDPKHPGDADGVGISYADLAAQVEKGTRILIDDGKIRVDVEEVAGGDIRCRVICGGPVSTKKRINVPDIHLDMEFLSDSDENDIRFGIEQDVDFVAASFVRNAEDVDKIRRFLDDNGGASIKIISKIENTEGVEHLDEILNVSDGVMVARGDMGVEVDFAKLPGIQKMCIDRCNMAGKPVITATQMLESMISSQSPTRAEITDVANAVYDGTSAVMLSAESASGDHPVLAVEVMARILRQAEEDLVNSPRHRTMEEIYAGSVTKGSADISTAIGHAACRAAEDTGARALIALTQSGYTAEMMARFRPARPVIAATPREKTARQLTLIHNVYPILTDQTDELDRLLSDAVEAARRQGFLASGDRTVVSAGLPLNLSGNTNMIRIETVI